jgi:predicted regulator of Ras-like GTPase activity (Roadblock/LC7/MglB family)
MSKPNLENLKQILDKMKNIGNLEGLFLAYRDGGLITENLNKIIDGNKFSSMCASVLESAEELGKTIGDEKINKIITEIEKRSILIFKCGEKIFLTIIFNDESKIGLIFDQLEAYIQQIIDEI